MDTQAAQRFVDWFKSNAGHLAGIRAQMSGQPTPPPEKLSELFGQLDTEISPLLQDIDSGLMFEVGPGRQKPHALILSAGGISDLIPVVQELQKLFGDVPSWEIIAFRPARPLDKGSLRLSLPEQEPRTVEARDILCALSPEKNKLAVDLYFKGFQDEHYESFGQLGFLCLDFSLGEYRVMEAVGELGFHSLDEAPDSAFPLEQLANRFELASNELRKRYAELVAMGTAQRIQTILDELKSEVAELAAAALEAAPDKDLFLQLTLWTTEPLDSKRLADALPRMDFDVQAKPSALGSGYRTKLTGSLPSADFQATTFLRDALSQLPSSTLVLSFGEQEIPNPFLAQLIASQLIEDGQIERAIKLLRAVIAKHEGEETGLLQALLGLAYLKNGEGECAARAYEEALANATDDSVRGEILNNRGSAYQKMGKLKEALSNFEEALKLNPESYGRQYNVGQAYAQLGKIEDACQHLALALNLNPEIRSHLENDKDLDHIRDSAPYIRMMAALE